MSRGERWRWIAAGVVVLAASGHPLMARNISVTPPPAPQPSQATAVASPPAQAPAGQVVSSPPAPGCSCGDRHGLTRWRWHRANCKRHLQENLVGYPEEFNEWPLGYSLYAHATTQVANAKAAKLIFYQYDFVDGTSQLNVRGRDKLVKIGSYLPTSFSPVVVERTPKEPGLDESRRRILVAELGRGSFPIPAERVVIGPPLADGLSGIEGLAIFGNQLQGIQSGGSLTGGVTGVGGFVGGAGALDAGGLSSGVTAAAPR